MSHILYPPSHQPWALESIKHYAKSPESYQRSQKPTDADHEDDKPLDFSKKSTSPAYHDARKDDKLLEQPRAVDYRCEVSRQEETPPLSPLIYARPQNGSMNGLPSGLHEAAPRLNLDIPRDGFAVGSSPEFVPVGSSITDRARMGLLSAPAPFLSPLPALSGSKPNGGAHAFSPTTSALGVLDPRLLATSKELGALDPRLLATSKELGAGYYPGAILNGAGILRSALQAAEGELDGKKAKQARPFKSYNPLPSNLPSVPLNVLTDYEDQEYRFQQFIEQYNARKDSEGRRPRSMSQEPAPNEFRAFKNEQANTDGAPQSPSTSGQVDSSPTQRAPAPSDVSSDASEDPQPRHSGQTAVTSSLNRNSKRTRTLPDEMKDAAYWERRKKNNEAAKRSRDSRRQKEDCIAMRAKFLELENQRLWGLIGTLNQQLRTVQCCAAHHNRM